MTVKGVYTGDAWEDIGATLIARFASIFGTGAASPTTTEGNLILQADVSSISVKVFDVDGAQIGTTLTPSAASTIFDTLQTAATWGNLSRGGNFRYSVDGSYFPTGGTTNRVEVVITLTDGHKLPAVWTLAVNELKGS
jgi:hypothetical protein